MTCSKCGEEPRATGSAWGKKCLAAARKAKRDATRHATSDATPVDATAHATELGALRLEVARLKRLLSEANAKLENGIVRFDRQEVVLSEGFPPGRIGSGKLSHPARLVCIHGSANCQALVCRAGRV